MRQGRCEFRASGARGEPSESVLDRDGVLNEDHGYVHRWEDFRWIPGAMAVIAAFNRAGWLVFVVTNQSGIGRGYYTEAAMQALHDRMAEDLKRSGARIDAFYHCPHHPAGRVPALARRSSSKISRGSRKVKPRGRPNAAAMS